MKVSHNKPTHITYGSYKHFNEEIFLLDVSRIPFQVCEIFNCAQEAYSMYETLLQEIVNEHARLKRKFVKSAEYHT